MAGSSFGQASSESKLAGSSIRPPCGQQFTQNVREGSLSYQFTKATLGLLENCLHPLIHGLLLLFQHLRVLALLETLEDLVMIRTMLA